MANDDINAGSKVLIFPIKDGKKVSLGPGAPAEVGKHICYHKTRSGELVTHGMKGLAIGDEVIVVHTRDGDLVGLRSGTPNPIRKCIPLNKFIHPHFEQHDPPDATWQYIKYDIELSQALDPSDIVNIVMDFEIECNGGGVQPWYPCGGVWIGFGPEKDEYYWPQGDPYITIRGQPAVVLGPGGYGTLVGELQNGNSRWCIEDFLGHLYPYGGASWPVKWIHVHMSQNSTLYFKNYLESRMVNFQLCVGTVENGWCERLGKL
ncbi:hypothetical protein GCM10025860_20620 [Methanobacterium ferruginis]|nr:hypothetical protein GCM10025860_20620 [Methanobacterium ferruginis]